MFTVYNKSNGNEVDVYNIRHDKSGYPHFLIYEDGQWKYRSAKHYEPYKEYYAIDLKDLSFEQMLSDL